MCQILKIFLLTALLLTVVKADDNEEEETHMTMDELITAMESFGDNCNPKPERKHYEELLRNERDAENGTKCFQHCLMKQFDVINEDDTQMNQSKMVDLLSMGFPGKEDDLNEIVENCNTENAGILEDCEAAHAHSMCLFDEMKANDFYIPEIKE